MPQDVKLACPEFTMTGKLAKGISPSRKGSKRFPVKPWMVLMFGLSSLMKKLSILVGEAYNTKIVLRSDLVGFINGFRRCPSSFQTSIFKT